MRESFSQADPSSEGAVAMDENEICRVIVDAAYQTHKQTGPGLLESVYETILSSARAAEKRPVCAEANSGPGHV